MKKAVLTLSQRRYGSGGARTEEPTRLPAQSAKSPRTPRTKSLTGGVNVRKKTSLTRQPRTLRDPAEQDDCNIHKPIPTEFVRCLSLFLLSLSRLYVREKKRERLSSLSLDMCIQ